MQLRLLNEQTYSGQQPLIFHEPCQLMFEHHHRRHYHHHHHHHHNNNYHQQQQQQTSFFNFY